MTCPGRVSDLVAASFAGRKESSGLGGIASFPGRKESICLGGDPSFPKERWAVAGRELLPSPGGKWPLARREVGDVPWAWLPTGVELAWEGMLTSLEGREVPAWVLVWGVLLSSPGGEALTCLFDWETKLLDQVVALALVIFPCFLLISILNVLTCLCLT